MEPISNGPALRIRWVKPAGAVPEFSAFDYHKAAHLDNVMLPDVPDTATELASESLIQDRSILPNVPANIRKILLTQGVPEVFNADGTPASVVESAIFLLKFAAEVEHALMVQYLYAYASVKNDTDLDQAVRKQLRIVATQEMGHLISVQNLLLAIGGPEAFHFGRDTIRANDPENPLPLVLENLSLNSLATYVVAEMPAKVKAEYQEKVQEIIQRVKDAGVAYHRVGAIYTKLAWYFQPDDQPRAPYNITPTENLFKAGEHISLADFKPQSEIDAYQASRAQWVKGGVVKFILEDGIYNNEAALTLLDAISEQGEGQLAGDDSHFEDFFELYVNVEDNPEKLTTANLPTILPDIPVSLQGISSADSSDGVSDGQAFLNEWADLFNYRYNIFLLHLWHTMATPVASRGDDMIDLFYECMMLLGTLTTKILALRETCGIPSAAPPYRLFYDYMANPWDHYQELIDKQDALIDTIKQNPLCSNADKWFLDDIKVLG